MPSSAPPTCAPDLCCPTCREALCAQQEALHCEVCHTSWPLREGIASFARGAEQCRDDPRARLATILPRAGDDDWEEVLHRRFAREDPAGYWHLYDPPCADWFHLGQVEARRLAIVLGPGLGPGAVPMRLARLFAHVIAVDWVWERVEFAQRLLAHEGLDNVTVVHGELGALPLPPAEADLVVLIGELERAAYHGEKGDAEAAQRALLARIFGLLRPGGALCLGTSNRFAVAHLLGRPDHGRPPWAGALPRPLGRLYGALRGEKARHALSHSSAGYRRLLDSVGFTDVSSYAAFPSHHHPRMLVPWADPARLTWAARLSLARRGRRLGFGAKLLHRMASSRAAAEAGCRLCGSLVTWARRPASPEPAAARRATLSGALQQRLLAEWPSLGLNGPRPDSLSIVQLSGNWDRGGKVNWFVFPGAAPQPAVVAKVARTPADAERMDHEYRMLCWLRSQPPMVGAHVPRPLARWEINGHLVALQQYAPWPPLTKQVVSKAPEAAASHALRAALPFLTGLALSEREECPPGAGNPYLANLIAEGRRAAAAGRYRAATRELFARLADLAAEAAGLSFTVPHQGDVSTADVLFAGPRDFHVLDWEWSTRRGLPLVDLVSLALSAASRHDATAVRRTIRTLAMLPVAPGEGSAQVEELVDGYCVALGLPRAWRRALVAAALLNAMLRTPECRISHLIISLPDEGDELIVAIRALLAGERTPEGPVELRPFVQMQRMER
jgi:SAM-dependent methyltransferase